MGDCFKPTLSLPYAAVGITFPLALIPWEFTMKPGRDLCGQAAP